MVDDGPSLGLQRVTLALAGVDLRQRDQAWVSLPLAPGAHQVELLNLEGRAVLPLAEGAAVPPGTYDQIRLRLQQGHVHSAQLAATGLVRDLAAPEELVATGLALAVTAGQTVDAVFLFSAAHAVQETTPGPGAYRLKPVQGRCLERASATGHITGRVTWARGGGPVAGATVTAQFSSREVLDPGKGYNRVQLARTVVTRADGSYDLDLLPQAAGPFRVVVLPAVGAQAHDLEVGPASTLPGGRTVCDLKVHAFQTEPGSIHGATFPGFQAGSRHTATLVTKAAKAGAWVIVGQTPFTENGPVDFEALSSGAYQVRFLAGGHANQREEGPAWRGFQSQWSRQGSASTATVTPGARAVLKYSPAQGFSPEAKKGDGKGSRGQ
jgi:hypothetical protein